MTQKHRSLHRLYYLLLHRQNFASSYLQEERSTCITFIIDEQFNTHFKRPFGQNSYKPDFVNRISFKFDLSFRFVTRNDRTCSPQPSRITYVGNIANL